MQTLVTLRNDVLARLGDLENQIWTIAEVNGHLIQAYKIAANAVELFYDWLYLENLAPGFSYTQPWEKPYLQELGGFDYGCANFTTEVDRAALGDEPRRIGPGNHTSPFEILDSWKTDLPLTGDIPATAELPKTLTAISRVSWDKRGLDALLPRAIMQADNRYETTRGEVYGFIWQKDGIRTLRKVRVPAAKADTVTFNGSWGIMRRPTEICGDAVTGSWGVPRRLMGHHPMGPESFGTPRRPFLEGKNVRVEYFRYGRALDAPGAVCELPDRYAFYLRDYVQWKCFERPGPGQDLALAQYFLARWTRNLARLERRAAHVNTEKTIVVGGGGRSSTTRPPRPQRPWPYGSVVR